MNREKTRKKKNVPKKQDKKLYGMPEKKVLLYITLAQVSKHFYRMHVLLPSSCCFCISFWAVFAHDPRDLWSTFPSLIVLWILLPPTLRTSATEVLSIITGSSLLRESFKRYWKSASSIEKFSLLNWDFLFGADRTASDLFRGDRLIEEPVDADRRRVDNARTPTRNLTNDEQAKQAHGKYLFHRNFRAYSCTSLFRHLNIEILKKFGFMMGKIQKIGLKWPVKT